MNENSLSYAYNATGERIMKSYGTMEGVYINGDKRVASRIGTGLFNNVYGRNGSYVTAGQQDYAERMNQSQHHPV